jgi:ABC-type transport system involved in cytochrome bd biosynthesis fused ATPase/permease subunit
VPNDAPFLPAFCTPTETPLKLPRELTPVLRGVDVEVCAGQLLVVCGRVASGKTALLRTLLGEMSVVAASHDATVGVVRLRGAEVALVQQTAWVRGSSLRHNIVMAEPFDAARYARVLDATALRHDVAMLPDGDETEIGARGVNLSGGQRQRCVCVCVCVCLCVSSC